MTSVDLCTRMGTVMLSVTTTHVPATDLGHLLHKHPDRVQRFEVTGGVAHVLYPVAGEQECTATLLLEVDPVALVRRGRSRDAAFALGQYVNDRPYVASSLLAVAMHAVFSTAMAGRCRSLPELAAAAIPLRLHLPAVPCRGGADLVERLFAPLGWQVQARPIPLDPTWPQWGDADLVDLTLTGTMPLSVALGHLYVMLPVLDDAKHYWVGPDEVDKLIRTGGGWLADHPERDLITRRYLANQRDLAAAAATRLTDLDGGWPEVDQAGAGDREGGDGADGGRVAPLVELRRAAVLATLLDLGARRVADLGCGDGELVSDLVQHRQFELVIAGDVSSRALDRTARRLHLDAMSDRQRDRVRVWQTSVVHRDDRLRGLDAVVLSEVIEHLDPWRLPALEAAVFGSAAPAAVIVTTPNAEYNSLYPGLADGSLRHHDHRFEWDRDQFEQWASGVAARRGYDVEIRTVGPADEALGSPTQLALFTRAGVES